MAKKRENEAVVNRFLFSTLYAIILELYIYYTYAAGVSATYFSLYQTVFNTTLILLGIGVVVTGIYSFGFKKISKYQFFVLLIMFLVVLFLRFSVYIPIAFPSFYQMASTKNRHIVAAIIGLLVYIYEFIRYIVKNR